jgi:hypothetical protein
MTTEAAITKLMYVLSLDLDVHVKHQVLEINLCGEKTPTPN